MLALLLLTAVLVAACFTIGQAVLAVCGYPRWTWWAPAVGYAVLLIAGGQVVHIPNHQRPLVVLVVVVAVGALALPFVRRAVRESLPDLVPLGALLILATAIPFFAFGRTGILGASISNDMSQHLLGSYWLRTHAGMLPVAAIGGDLITTGYPLGPHGLAAELARASGLGDVRAFSALTMAVPVLTAFAVLGLVPNARRAPRWALAAVVGLGYLPAAFLAQGSFKEPIEGMLALATALALADLARGDGRIGWRRGAPIGLLAAATIYNYSYGGILWIGAVIAVFLAFEVLWRRELFSVIRRWLLAGVGAAVAGALAIASDVDRIRAFRQSIFGSEPLHNKGNLWHSLNPLESLGVWFNGDFRFNPSPRWPTLLFSVLALIALAGGLSWWWRGRALAVPAAVAAALLVWVGLTQTVNIYNAGKGLVVLAPLVAACIGAPLVAAWTTRTRAQWTWPVRLVGLVLLGGAVVASGAALRSAPVGLGAHETELDAMRPLVKGKAVLFVENDHFAQWELRGADPLYTTNALYAPAHLGMHPAKNSGLPIDVDNFGHGELDKLDFLVVAGGAYQSEIPPNFRLVLHTRSYDLYRRHGRTPTSTPAEPPSQPGVVFDCRAPRANDVLAKYRWAGVLPQPVVTTAWQGSIGRPGESARLRVTLPRGRWDISLQYLSRTPVTLEAPGLHKTLDPNFGLITSFWPGGTLRSDGRPLTLTATAGKRPWFGNLLGPMKPMRAPLSPNFNPLFHAAFTRHGATPRRVLATHACGRYVDWFAPAGSHMTGRR